MRAAMMCHKIWVQQGTAMERKEFTRLVYMNKMSVYDRVCQDAF